AELRRIGDERVNREPWEADDFRRREFASLREREHYESTRDEEEWLREVCEWDAVNRGRRYRLSGKRSEEIGWDMGRLKPLTPAEEALLTEVGYLAEVPALLEGGGSSFQALSDAVARATDAREAAILRARRVKSGMSAEAYKPLFVGTTTEDVR
ncbi:MAG: hypothetical protein M3138_03110, partial [Actinomycetota bacterium]|nr:hypothetical protein [Actinomycetota bacterium]